MRNSWRVTLYKENTTGSGSIAPAQEHSRAQPGSGYSPVLCTPLEGTSGAKQGLILGFPYFAEVFKKWKLGNGGSTSSAAQPSTVSHQEPGQVLEVFSHLTLECDAF